MFLIDHHVMFVIAVIEEKTISFDIFKMENKFLIKMKKT